MSFSAEVDALFAKVQSRVDEAMGEAREELKGMAADAEVEWAALRQRLEAAFCHESDNAADVATSQEGTSTPHDPPATGE